MASVSLVYVHGEGHVDANAVAVHEASRMMGVDVADLTIGRLCPRCGSSSHGRPFLASRVGPAPYVSLSRAGGATLVAVSSDAPVGVDVDRPDRMGFEGFETVALHPHEQVTTLRDRAIVWTRKEALVKATGAGLSLDPTTVRISLPGQPPELLTWPVGVRRPGPVVLTDLDLGPAHVAALAVLTNDETRISLRTEGPAEAAGRASRRATR